MSLFGRPAMHDGPRCNAPFLRQTAARTPPQRDTTEQSAAVTCRRADPSPSMLMSTCPPKHPDARTAHHTNECEICCDGLLGGCVSGVDLVVGKPNREQGGRSPLMRLYFVYKPHLAPVSRPALLFRS